MQIYISKVLRIYKLSDIGRFSSIFTRLLFIFRSEFQNRPSLRFGKYGLDMKIVPPPKPPFRPYRLYFSTHYKKTFMSNSIKVYVDSWTSGSSASYTTCVYHYYDVRGTYSTLCRVYEIEKVKKEVGK